MTMMTRKRRSETSWPPPFESRVSVPPKNTTKVCVEGMRKGFHRVQLCDPEEVKVVMAGMKKSGLSTRYFEPRKNT